MTPENFNAAYDDWAIYLPSLQQGYAAFPFREAAKTRDGQWPAGLKPADLDFLNPSSKLWHCKYVLYSAGQFDTARITVPDMVSKRSRTDTVVIGDSGGYQVGTHKLKELQAWPAMRDPQKIMQRWTQSVSIRERVLRWLDTNCDYAMTLDMPLWILTQPKAAKSPFRRLSYDQLTELSYVNLKYFADNRGKATGAKAKYLNVLQDVGEDTGERWYQRVKGFGFEGWSFGGDNTVGIAPFLKWVVRLLNDGEINSKTEWLHVLQMSPPVNSVLLTAIQRRLREILGTKIVVSYDSSSPVQSAGISQSIVLPPNLTANFKTWKMRAVPFPQHPDYKNPAAPVFFTDALSPVTQLVSINDFHWKTGPMETRFFDPLAQHLLTNHNIYMYHKAVAMSHDYVFGGKSKVPGEIEKQLEEINAALA